MGTPTLTQLQGGLGGAIGSDFRTAQHQLVFVEFDTGKLSELTVAPATPGYKALGTGYNQPEDVRLSMDGVHAYVTERTGDLVKVALTSANRSAATVVATGMTAPQQLFLDEAHTAAYVVEYASPGSLLKIDLKSGAKTVVTAALDYPIGLVLSSDLQYAYVSEQTTGPDKGRISQIQMSSAARTTLAKGLTNPFFLTWADAAQESLLFPQRDPANSLLSVSVTSGATSTVSTGLPFRPSCVAVPNPWEILVCCDSVIEELNFAGFAGDLLMGIGYTPAPDINSSGFATVTSGLNPVSNAPFGGELPIMVNFPSAASAKAAYYQVQVDGIPQTATWSASTTTGGSISISAQTIKGTPGCYAVPPAADIYPPGLGYILDSTALSDGTHKIVLVFLDSSGKALTPALESETLTIMVNNEQCVAVLFPPVVGGTAANTCGMLQYSATTETVSLPFTASQPADFATFSFALDRGVTPSTAWAPPLPALPSGPVSTASSPIEVGAPPAEPTVGALLGTTCTTAAFALELYVAATMNNGLGRQSQYDAEALMGFALTK
jgi:hypothetical protein